MSKLQKIQVEPMNSKSEKKDIITEMFKHFEIKVIDVTNQNSKSKKKK